MPTKELIQYVDESLKNGIHPRKIHAELLEVGWRGPLIKECIACIQSVGLYETPTMPAAPQFDEMGSNRERAELKTLETESPRAYISAALAALAGIAAFAYMLGSVPILQGL